MSMGAMRSRTALGATVLAAALAGAPPAASAQGGVYAYPTGGQAPAQQQRDQTECHQWSVSQTGFDPNNVPRAASSGTYASRSSGGNSTGFIGIGGDKNLAGGQGGVMSDAATGAAFGAIGGAIAGNAGAGAAIGAMSSALFGGIARSSRAEQDREWQREQEANARRQQQQAEQQAQAGMSNYRRAYATCMESRNYRVN